LTLGISLFLVIPCKDNKKIVTRPLFVGKVVKKGKKPMVIAFLPSSFFPLTSAQGLRRKLIIVSP